MQLTAERRKQTGAFYTPSYYADLAVRYMSDVLNEPEKYAWYDPCAGEGALLEAVKRRFPNAFVFGTTLEAEDVEICQSKGIPCRQMDFLNTPMNKLYPPELYGFADNLLIITNPPYENLSAVESCQILAYQEVLDKYDHKTQNKTILFYYRMLEFDPVLLGCFHKIALIQGAESAIFRENVDWEYSFMPQGFVCPSNNWEGLSKGWGIAFTMRGLTYGATEYYKKEEDGGELRWGHEQMFYIQDKQGYKEEQWKFNIYNFN